MGMKKNQLAVIGVSLFVLIFAVGFGFYYYKVAQKTAEHVATNPESTEPNSPTDPVQLKSAMDLPEVKLYLAEINAVQDSDWKKTLAEVILYAVKVIEVMSKAEVSLSDTPEIPGIRLSYNEMDGSYDIDIDYAFFKDLAKTKGTPADLVFLDFKSSDIEHQISGDSKAEYENGFVPCLETKKSVLLKRYQEIRAVYEKLKSTPYLHYFEIRPGILHIPSFEEAFTNFNCYCSPEAEVLTDLKSSQAELKGSELYEMIPRVIRSLQNGENKLSFNGECLGFENGSQPRL
jgi:hypothetical protein